MSVTIPKKKFLEKTVEVDYFDWNYKFPIKYIQRYRFNKIRQLLGDKIYPRLLEVGTGSGIFIPELAKHCERIFACDIHSNFKNIELLCKHYGVHNCSLSTQNIEQTTYPDNYFDVIVAVSVLEFVNNIPKALSEIKRILKRNGLFVTICPMESKLLDYFLSFYSLKSPKEEFGNARQKVTSLLEENFEVDKKGYMIPLIGKIFPVYTHYRLIKP